MTFVTGREPSKYVAHPKTSKDIKVPTTRTKLMNHMEATVELLSLLRITAAAATIGPSSGMVYFVVAASPKEKNGHE
jgi:hypothetical protein